MSDPVIPFQLTLHDQMSEPKWVIAMGICASAGGPFNNYAIIQGVDKVIPVDVYVPGCPPRPEALLYAIEKLREKQGKETFRLYREMGTQVAPAPAEIESLEVLRAGKPA